MSYIPGKLKLKGAPLPVANGGIKKTQKKKASLTSEQLVTSTAAANPDSTDIQLPEDPRTPAQIAYEQALEKRQKQRIKQLAAQSHKEKVENFNKKLAKMTDIHDIPKVDPRNQ